MNNIETFELDFPLSRPHCGIPMGNGNMGVLVWGEGNKLCLTVNRADFWDRRQGERVMPGQTYRELVEAYDKYDVSSINDCFVKEDFPMKFRKDELPWTSTRLPVGRFELLLSNEVNLEKAILDYDSGILTIESSCGILKLIQSLNKHLLIIEDKAKLIVKAVPRPAWEWVQPVLEKVGYAPPVKYINGWHQTCPADPGITVEYHTTTWGGNLYINIDGETAETADMLETVKYNKKWWQSFWHRNTRIDIPDKFLNSFFKLALYKFACATHPSGYPCSLQGPWLEEYQRATWNCDYHFNVNVQQVYTLALATGNFNHMLPLFDMLESAPFQKVMRDNAKNLFGIGDGLLLTHAVDDKGQQCGGIDAGGVLDFACGGWTAQLYWLYYKYTLDEKFLIERAYPFMCGIMRVFEETLEKCNDKLSMPLSISAEYGCTFPVKKDGKLCHQNTGRDPSYQLSCIHMLVNALIEACSVINQKPRPVWSEIKKLLPMYTQIGEEGNERIAIWDEQDLEVCHRHHSHLALIYPFDLSHDWTDEDIKIINNTVDHWISIGMGEWSEWCYPWAAIIHARMGFKESPAILLDIWKRLFINESMATVYRPRFRGLSARHNSEILKPLEYSEVMQIDGTMSGATAIIEMLVHQKGDTVFLFPAVPGNWPDVEFENVYLPNGIRISAERKGGKTSRIKVFAKKDCRLKLKYPELNETVEIELRAEDENLVSINR